MTTQGPYSPSTMQTYGVAGGVSWNNPTNVGSSNNSYATASLRNKGTDYLFCMNFGFSVPDNAIIDGFIGECEGNSTTGTSRSYLVKLIKGGLLVGNSFATTTVFPVSDSYLTYGGASELGGVSWTAANVNATDCGWAIAIEDVSGGSAVISVDHIRLSVVYHLPTGTLEKDFRGIMRGVMRGAA